MKCYICGKGKLVKKKLPYVLYGIKIGDYQGEKTVSAKAFNCLAPLYYFERSRTNCGHAGRCREEGLLLALLDGKKTLDYSHKDVTDLPTVVRRRKAAKAVTAKRKKAATS